jgi:hypothetical protein
MPRQKREDSIFSVTKYGIFLQIENSYRKICESADEKPKIL